MQGVHLTKCQPDPKSHLGGSLCLSAERSSGFLSTLCGGSICLSAKRSSDFLSTLCRGVHLTKCQPDPKSHLGGPSA